MNVRINKIKNIYKDSKFILTSTSFPRYVNEIGKDDTDTFRLNEIDLFNEVIQAHGSNNVLYSDYGSINPIRNDRVIMSRGWIPRIDVPLEKEIFYYRKRKETREYYQTYTELARDKVVKDKRFPKKLNKNWGINQINACANGNARGSSPSFSITVRMNIHIE